MLLNQVVYLGDGKRENALSVPMTMIASMVSQTPSSG